MAKVKTNSKRQLIDKANASMIVAIAVAAFVVTFSLVASRALLSQRSYQSRVITGKEKAVKQLDSNKQAVQQLAVSYKAFVDTPDNVIGGNPNGTGDRDGNNAKIVLDALPSKYDFPAFITSVETLLKTKNFPLGQIGGTDDEVSQSSAKNTEPVEIPFQMATQVGGYGNVKDMLETLELSIRPIKIKTLHISGGSETESKLSVEVEGVSYFQAAKGLTIEKKVMK